jgi:DNA-binding FrmR family transcriptional regulator
VPEEVHMVNRKLNFILHYCDKNHNHHSKAAARKLLEGLASSLIKRHLKSTLISEEFQGSYAAAPQGFFYVMRRKISKCLKEKHKKQGTIQKAQGIKKNKYRIKYRSIF